MNPTLGHYLEKKLRPRIKATIYKRLYGGELTFVDSCLIHGYRHLPNPHPIVRLTLEAPTRPQTTAEAKALGYTIDRHSYPWTAYKGERMRPSEWFPIRTDEEQAGWDAAILWRRRCLLVGLVAFTLLVTGCASLLPDEGWAPAPTHKPLPVHYVYVDGSQIGANCGWPAFSNFVLHGCAKRLYSEGVCLIFVEPSPPRWLQKHEEKHCAGYDHTGQTPLQ